MKTTRNPNGSVSITLSAEEIEKLSDDWREIESHFDMDTFFDGDDNGIESLVKALNKRGVDADDEEEDDDDDDDDDKDDDGDEG